MTGTSADPPPRPAQPPAPDDDDRVPISALQHLAFCPRQAALIHVEQAWADNALTVEGTHLHERTDKPHEATRGDARVCRRLDLWSDAHGLIGIADIVELHPDPTAPHGGRPYPIEYKRGRLKGRRARPATNPDAIQLCAQALCLEERFGIGVPAGALFYGRTRRRVSVALDDAELRATTLETLAAFRLMRANNHTPTAPRQPKCRSCSLLAHCRPSETANVGAASTYVSRLVHETARTTP